MNLTSYPPNGSLLLYSRLKKSLNRTPTQNFVSPFRLVDDHNSIKEKNTKCRTLTRSNNNNSNHFLATIDLKLSHGERPLHKQPSHWLCIVFQLQCGRCFAVNWLHIETVSKIFQLFASIAFDGENLRVSLHLASKPSHTHTI